MTLHRVTEPAVNFPKSHSAARVGTWAFDLCIIAKVVGQVLRELCRRDLDRSTWRMAILWWALGEPPDTMTAAPDRGNPRQQRGPH